MFLSYSLVARKRLLVVETRLGTCATDSVDGPAVGQAVPHWELYQALHFVLQEQLLSRNVERFRGGIVFKADNHCIPQLQARE